MPNKNFKIILSYDGTEFYGWQKTATGPSIQEALELAFQSLTGQSAEIEAASRTDRGVHAKGQTVHALLDCSLEPRRLLGGLNAHLPPAIRIQSLEEAPLEFHATLAAQGKKYCYFICNSAAQIPMHRLYSWHFPWPLDLEIMRSAANDVLGTHDFSALTNERTDDAIRTIESISIIELEHNRIKIELQGDRFLYKMARTIVGTLAYIGCKKLPADCIPNLLALKDRTKAGVTAPAHGLFLWQVNYS